MAVYDPSIGILPDWPGYQNVQPDLNNPGGLPVGGGLPFRFPAAQQPAPQQLAPESSGPGMAAPAGGGALNTGNSWFGQKAMNPLFQLGMGIAGPQFAQGGKMAYAAGQGEQERQGLRDTYDAARAAGATHEQAQTLSLNPTGFKAMQPQYHQIQTGMFGEQTPFQLSPFGGQATPVDMSKIGGGTGGAGGAFSSTIGKIQALGPEATVEQRLAQVPVEGRGLLKSLIEGKEQPASWGRMGAQGRAGWFALAQEIDPSFDPTVLAERQSFAKKEADTNRNSYGGLLLGAGTALSHGAQAHQYLAELESHLNRPGRSVSGPQFHETGATVLNPIEYQAIKNGSDTKAKELLAKYESQSDLYAKELEAYITNGHGTGKERAEINRELSLYHNAPSSVKGAWQAKEEALLGKLGEMAAHRERAFRRPTTPEDLLSAEAKQNLAKSRAIRSGGAPAPAGPTPLPQSKTELRDGQPYKLPNGTIAIWDAKKQRLIPQ